MMHIRQNLRTSAEKFPEVYKAIEALFDGLKPEPREEGESVEKRTEAHLYRVLTALALLCRENLSESDHLAFLNTLSQVRPEWRTSLEELVRGAALELLDEHSVTDWIEEKSEWYAKTVEGENSLRHLAVHSPDQDLNSLKYAPVNLPENPCCYDTEMWFHRLLPRQREQVKALFPVQSGATEDAISFDGLTELEDISFCY